jgi:hypothetical protein
MMACERPAARLKAEGQEWSEKCVAGHACDTSSIEYIGDGRSGGVFREGKTVRSHRESTSKFISAMNAYRCAGKHTEHHRKMLPMVVLHLGKK